MKLVADFLPILAFFVVYRLGGLYAATGAAIAISVAQIGWLKARRRPVEPMQWIGLAIIVVFGGATLLLHDPVFIKWKPTVLYWLFAVVLAGGLLLFRRNLIRSLLGAQLALPDPVWLRLNLAWMLFFAAMGVLNLYVAYNYEESTWVNFKLFGSLGLTLTFVVAQGLYLGRHVREPDAPAERKS